MERLTATLPKIFTNITIDGNPLKMVWDTLPQIQIERMILSETDGFTGPEDLSAYWKACYNDDGLYVLVHVTADDIHRTDYSYGEFWEQDRIEVYVDMNSPNLYDAMGPSTGVNMGQSNNGHYQVATLAEPNDPSHEWEPGSTKAVKLYPDNTYTYEVFIPWVNIPDINGIVFEPDDEKPISMDIIICDNDGTESDQPRHRMVWSNTGVVNEAWYNMDDCGTVDFEISTTPVDSSRFAWYPFNGNTDDASGNNHQGTNNNVDFAADRFGLVNSSGFFDGYTSYVAIENSEEFNLADSLTVSAWIKSNGFINIMARIVTNWHLTYEGYEHYTVTLRTNGSVDARIDTDQISLPYYFDDIQSWHLVSLVYKNPVLRLYVDNKFVQMDTAYTDGYDPTNNVPVIIGGGGSWNNTMPTYIFSGEIDDVSFYRKALSDDDINRLYQNYHPPKVFQAIPDNGQVTLRWSAEQMNRLSQIRIFRNDGLLESLEVNSPDDTAFVDTQVTNGQSYHYYITTVDTMNYESMPSEMVEVMPAVLLPEEYTADANTVMLLHMNESSGSMVYDFSGNNNNGTINGSVAGNGKMGKAREFYYSNDQVSIEDDPSLHFGTEPYTIEFWLKTQPGSGGHPLHKRGNTTSGTTGRGWFTNIGNNKISITIYNDPALDGEDGSTHFESNTIIADNAWHHIAFIIGTESIQCYIDGMLDNETTIHWPGSSDNDGIIEIGATSHTGDFTGVLDEIRISNKARTPEEFNVFPYMMVTAPKTGDSWQIGFEREITWEAIGTSGNVHIEYSVDNGSTWTDVISSTPDDGSCNWMVPNEPTSMGMIRVSDAAGSLSDETDGTFSINTVEDCLVAYYPFNGNANDESGRGNNGILEGTVLCSDRFGNPDNAFSFDGMDDRIYVENIDDFKFTSYTFTGWMKTSKCPSTEQWIVGKNQDDNTSKYNYGVVLQPNMAVKSEYESCFYEYDHIQSSEPMQLNDWVFFAAVRDNSTGRHTLYVNGENTGSYVWYNTPCNNDQQFNIGSRNNIAWFNGIIDDIRVYNCALDSSLINAFYTEGGYAPVSAPTNFTAVPENGQILLSWEASEVVNLHKYNIYRDNDDLSVFIYDSTTGTPPDTFYLDTNIETGRMYYYLLSTVDDAGNESSMAFDRCQVPDTVNVLYKTEPMTIDGIGDESLWQNMDPITITHVIEGLVDDAADLSATFKAYWDTDSIYFLVEVTDDSLYNGDGSAWVNDAVELYFDMNNSKNENIEKLSWDQVYDGDDRQIRFVWEGDITGQNIPEGIRYAFTTNEDRHGYVLELSVSALDLSFPYDGFFGFDIDIIDNDDTGDRQAIMAWNSYAVENYRDPSRNGIAIMADFHEIISETHFTTVWTGNGWEQMNLYALTATIDGVDMQPGDEIAVFDGEYCVGAGVLTEVLNGTTTYLMFIASHNDAEPPDVNGFEEGHEIIFRLWDVSEQAEVTTVEAIYTAGTGLFEPNGTAAFYLSGITTLEQSIPLTAGWNIFSLAVDPEETTIPEIVQSLVNESSLIKVQDEAGHAYEYVFPIGWTNNIPAWSMTEGYKIKVNFTTTLVVTGAPVPLPVEIPLITGWNVIGYPALEQQSIQGVLSELISSNHLIKVQDEAGMAIEYVFPIGWVDKIVNFRPGEGYKVKVNTDDAITIDEPGSLKSTFSEKMKDVSPVHFKPVYEGYGLDHMNIYLTSAKLNGKPLETGDEVGLFDDDRCVGAGVVRSDELPYLSLVASKDDPETGEADGFIAGNPITLRIWSNRYALELRVDNLSFFTGYCDTFDPLATTVASFNLTASGLPGSDGWTTSLGDNYPNPFSDETTLEFTLGEMSVVDISVYNLMGEKVKTLVHQSMASGSYKTIWDASDQRDAKVPPGIYLCKMIAGNNIFVKPMEVIR
ncbi:MAG: T9SS type A sorting domain-containing protein [Bacteroidales bacterium]|nr:T9SS type A sorting domain-containing protein [Bacteroidales bacterium]